VRNDFDPGDSPPFPDTNRFQPLALLGRGGMGWVYRAYDRETAAEVALKTLGAVDPERLHRLKREFRALAGISHPNLVELYELFVTDRDCFFTMELVNGMSFVDHVRGGARPGIGLDDPALGRLIDAGRQVVLGLSSVHAAGRLHRDVKPQNILVTHGRRAVILDFGLGTVLDPEGAADPLRDTGTDRFAGTLAYMAPEQARGGPLSEAADWYSTGVMLYQALAGRLPFEGSPMRILTDKGGSAPISLRERGFVVPEVLDSIVLRLLHPEPDARPEGPAILAALDAARPVDKRAKTPRAPRSLGVPFVGRTGEGAQLRGAFDSVRSGHAVTVHVSGPSGIGKSELVRRFVATLEREERVWVLRGRCHPQEAVPYKAFDALVDGLTRALLSSPDAVAAAVVPRYPSALVRLFPVLARVPAFGEWADAPLDLDPHEIRRRGFAAFRDMLGRLADRQPVVLWIDDLQWADLDSEALLRELRRPPDAPVLLTLLSYRDEPDDAVSSRITADDDTTVEQQVVRLRLGPLAEEETRELAGKLYEAQPEGKRYVDDIVSESAGSPFLIGELARHVSALRLLGGDVGSRTLRLGDVIRDRVRQLSPPARRFLEIVCVAGQPLDRSLALKLAGVGERGRPLVTTLGNACLVRSTTVHGGPGVEAYHDRIREVVVEALPARVTRAHHAELAVAAIGSPNPDPEAVFRHLLGADRRPEAAEWAARAAERASNTLAFVRAAELYRQALSLATWDVERSNSLEICLADALVNAGRGAAAAPIYSGVATRNTGLARLELRRRAAEQHPVTGHIEEGIAQLRSLFADLELPYPVSTGRAWLGLLQRLLQFAVRGTAFVARDEAAIDRRMLLRIDACDSAAKGLLQVDPIRGIYFSATGLLLSLRAGEIRRIGRDVCLGGSLFVAAGGPIGAWGRRILERARRVADDTRDPYLLGLSAIVTGIVALTDGRWAEALRDCDAGTQILAEQCRGVAWERNQGRMVALRALEELGEVGEVIRRADSLRQEAEEVGDIYAQITARQFAAFWRIAKGDVAGAREETSKTLALWTHRGYHLQHFYALRLQACCDIYEGAPRAAAVRLLDAWAALKRSGLLRHPVVRVDGHLTRGRVMLAAAAADVLTRRALRATARSARSLSREARADARAHADVLRAGIASVRGRRLRALELLSGACERFAAEGLPLAAAYARRRWGEMLGGSAGERIMREADAVMTSRGIQDSVRWLAVHAPGFTG